jgi:site-specific recombinase XerD
LINNSINYFLSKAKNLYHKETERGNYINAEQLKDLVTGNYSRERTLNALLDYHLADITSRIGSDYVPRTVSKYQATHKYVKEYLNEHYNICDIHLHELNFRFINEFEVFLKAKKTIAHNQVCKHIERVKKAIKIALANEWIEKDPFMKFVYKLDKTNREFLSEYDLQKLENVELENQRHKETRDSFIFSCYTGISFKDLQNMDKTSISKDINGDFWIRKDRLKTGNPYSVMLLPKALEIIKKYENHPKILHDNTLIPMMSNASMNIYLKVIAKELGFINVLSFHIARHTFATTIALTNGVPIETLSKMLGHTSIKTTQIYGKVIEKKIGEDMRNLKIRLQNQSEIVTLKAVAN